MKALIINRIGDIGLILAMVHIVYMVNSLDFNVLFGLTPDIFLKTIIIFGYEIYLINLIGFLIFIGAMGKSAQIGLHT
jgi:NADH-quinone oxidoreductase subunit L